MTHLRHENMPPVEAPRWKRFQHLLGRHGVIHVEDKRIAQRFYEYGIGDAIAEARKDIEDARRMVRVKNEELEALREHWEAFRERSNRQAGEVMKSSKFKITRMRVTEELGARGARCFEMHATAVSNDDAAEAIRLAAEFVRGAEQLKSWGDRIEINIRIER